MSHCYYSESDESDIALGLKFLWKNLGFSVRLDKETKVIPKTEYKLLDFSGRAITKVFLNKI